jgi:hypothetical protein
LLSKRFYDNQNFRRILGLVTEAELNNRKVNISKECRRNEAERRNIVAEVSFQVRALDVNQITKSYGEEFGASLIYDATIPLAEIGRRLLAYDVQVEEPGVLNADRRPMTYGYRTVKEKKSYYS